MLDDSIALAICIYDNNVTHRALLLRPPSTIILSEFNLFFYFSTAMGKKSKRKGGSSVVAIPNPLTGESKANGPSTAKSQLVQEV